MFEVLAVRVGKRGLRGEQGSVTSLGRRALPQPPAGLLREATLGFPPKPRFRHWAPNCDCRFSPLTAVRTHLPLTSPGLLCGSEHPKFAQLIQ